MTGTQIGGQTAMRSLLGASAVWIAVAAPPAHAQQGGRPAAGGDDSAFPSADEAARQSSNPLGGDFFILLSQWDN